MFQKKIWKYYREHRRSFPWREFTGANPNPYHIVVSEVMLQQTQAPRVVPKYKAFIAQFPSFEALAAAPLTDVLQAWQGLGYNRRAIALKKLASIVVTQYAGSLPHTYDELLALPSIGPNTAGSILAFAFNIPHPFIETNIRSVFLHFFFKNSLDKIHDRDLILHVARTLDQKNPREWYYALMDYGVYLKKSEPNPSRRSVHHTKQTTFKGSNRELRAQIIAYVLKRTSVTEKTILQHFSAQTRTGENIDNLINEGFLKRTTSRIRIATL